MVQGVEYTLTMIAGIMRLLLTDRGLDCLLYSSQGQGLRTNVNSSCVVASTLHQANHKQGTWCEKRTVEPGNRQAPDTITSEYGIAYIRYNSLR